MASVMKIVVRIDLIFMFIHNVLKDCMLVLAIKGRATTELTRETKKPRLCLKQALLILCHGVAEGSLKGGEKPMVILGPDKQFFKQPGSIWLSSQNRLAIIPKKF